LSVVGATLICRHQLHKRTVPRKGHNPPPWAQHPLLTHVAPHVAEAAELAARARQTCQGPTCPGPQQNPKRKLALLFTKLQPELQQQGPRSMADHALLRSPRFLQPQGPLGKPAIAAGRGGLLAPGSNDRQASPAALLLPTVVTFSCLRLGSSQAAFGYCLNIHRSQRTQQIVAHLRSTRPATAAGHSTPQMPPPEEHCGTTSTFLSQRATALHTHSPAHTTCHDATPEARTEPPAFLNNRSADAYQPRPTKAPSWLAEKLPFSRTTAPPPSTTGSTVRRGGLSENHNLSSTAARPGGARISHQSAERSTRQQTTRHQVPLSLWQ